jgi:phage shock protein PspC (stress-responsive transcriptional regulator)
VPPQRPIPGAGFFDAVRRLGVVRPDQGRVIGGVCAGLANRWGVSPVAVRVLFVLVGLLFGAGLFLYGLLWMFLPHPDGRIHAQELLRGTLTAGFFGALIAILAGAPFGVATDDGPSWVPLLLIAAVVVYLVRRRRSRTAG